MKIIIHCCICEKEVHRNNTMTPSICYRKYMNKSHRICSYCWFNPDTGFALENRSHECPGCIKKLPLTKVSYDKTEVIDLTD
jgi:hypothetical protein